VEQRGDRAEGEQRFGDVLRHYRALAGLTQEGLAERAGLSRRGIADLERGARHFPYPDTARRLADALDLNSIDRALFMVACRPERPGDLRPRYTLPLEPAPIVGRRAELSEAGRLAAAGRLLTITGPPGIGKSRIALELAHRTESEYRDGAVAVDLAPVPDDTLVPVTVAAALGARPSPGRAAAEIVREHVHARQLLLVLDNCEHLVVACAHLADALLRDALGVRILITSRESLRIHGEVVWAAPPLTAEDAAALLMREALAAGASAFTSDELEVIRDLGVRLEGLPLAIQLAAARVPALGVAQVAKLLDDRFAFLAGGSRVDPPRHRTIRAALDWSFQLLNPTEQRVMARLATFVGGWNLEAAREVCGHGEISDTAAMDALEGLVEKSVVGVDDTTGDRRYRFLETVREYASERLEAGSGAASTRDRHAAYFLAVAEVGASTRLGIRYPGDPVRLRLEHANLRAALRWLFDTGRFDDGLSMCQALSGFWLSQGFLLEGETWFARFLDRPDPSPSTEVAAGLCSWGRLSEYAGDLDEALERFQRSRSVSNDLGDLTVWARACCGLGDLALHHNDYAQALDIFTSAADAAHRVASTPEEAQALLGLGRVTSLMGDPQMSKAWMESALTLLRQLGDRWGVAYVLNEWGQQARRDGELERARTLLEECHVLWRQTGTRMGERAAIMNLALVSLELGATHRAAELALESLELTREIGDDASTTPVRCIEIAAQTLGALGARSTAILLTAAATQRREALGAPRPAIEQPEMSRLLDRVREGLDRPAFEAAWASGVALPINIAIDLALAELTSSMQAR
jgi:predicted ATPase/DNA-binding XRE family transcriptional regulator